jgi:hypothetical protein
MLNQVSAKEFLPKLRDVSTQSMGNISKLMTGMNRRMTHHEGLLIILVRMIAL